MIAGSDGTVESSLVIRRNPGGHFINDTREGACRTGPRAVGLASDGYSRVEIPLQVAV